MDIVSAHAPLIKVRNRQQSLKWIDRDIRMLMRSRNYYLQKFRKNQDPLDWDCYRRLKNAVKKGLRNAKKNHLEDACT